jgi:hypothetical protein
MDDADYDDDEAGSGEDSGEEDEEMHDGEEPVDLQAKLAAKKANPLLKGLLRSKGVSARSLPIPPSHTSDGPPISSYGLPPDQANMENGRKQAAC